MKATIFAATFALATLVAATAPQVAHGAGDGHKLVIHVDDNDPKKMNLALNNAENVINYFESKGEKIEVEIVAYGPGLTMFRADKSPVKARIEKMSLGFDNLQFSACGVTRGKMAKKEGKDIPIMSEVTMVPAGVVRIMELQDAGWNYIRP
jgi:hypothetical protein